ncbi:metallophosphoesterase family protein [Noviherbaspirillum aridicola]|uniref:Phosphoesterase n=1 Tax=Noviherbaspirillum aridicola TaxID=2849687 RepID=A0ABQ4Q4X6_9BURK|nr:metallophosphoesterase family protein [Noviherbaspirillum aridicola]GIZ52238.1 phosphoesterase [Noviherbaspirillum aridicola]
MKTLRIGVISDTHNLLRPEARLALAGVDRIIHAGDICRPEVLEQLSAIAPVTAVRGNNDRGDWAQALRHQIVEEIDGVRILVVHDKSEADPGAAGADVVITGHSHKPNIVREAGVLFLNPGSAGPRRFRLPISLAFLEIANGEATARLQVLEVD